MRTFQTKISSTFVFLTLITSMAQADRPMIMGPTTAIEFSRIDQILVRCGAESINGKSRFMEEIVKKAQYFFTEQSNIEICNANVVCSAGTSTWFNINDIENLSYRERALRMVYERLVQSPRGPSSKNASRLVKALATALPLFSRHYFGQKVKLTGNTVNEMNQIPEILSALGLYTSNKIADSRSCTERIFTTNETVFAASESLRKSLKEKEKIFDERAQQSIKRAGDNLVGDSGDTLLWTGIYIASQAHRYKVTGDQEAIRNMEPSLWALHDLHKVTGNKTLVARRMQKQPDKTKELPKEWFRGAAGYEDYIWRGHVSWDMYVGYLYGIAESWDIISDQKLKAALKEDLREIALGFIENGMAISGFDTYLSSDPDGCFIDHRQCGFLERLGKNVIHYFAVKTGNALRSLVLLQTASIVTEDAQIKKAYQSLLDHAWWIYAQKYGLTRSEKIIGHILVPANLLVDLIHGKEVDVNLDTLLDPVGSNLGHLTHFILTRQEKNPKVKSIYLNGFKDVVHRSVKNDYNSFWNFQLASLQGKNYRASEVEDSLESLYRFPLDKYENRSNSANPDIPKYQGITGSFFKSDSTPWYSYEPIPLDIRPMHGFAWQNNAYRLDGEFEEASPGVPFLAAYWLGRLSGFIGSED